MSRGSFAAIEKHPVAKIAVIRRPIAPPFEHDDAFAKIDELLDLEAPTRRGHDLARQLAAVSATFDEEEKPTLMVAPQENLRRIAAAFAETEKHPATEDDVTLDEPAPLSMLADTRMASFKGEPPPSGIQRKRQDDQTLLVAGIWAAALSAMGVLAFFLTSV